MIVVEACFLLIQMFRVKQRERQFQRYLRGKGKSVIPKSNPTAEVAIVQRSRNLVRSSYSFSSSSGSSKEVERLFSDRDSKKSSNASSYYTLSKDSNTSISLDDLE